MELNQLLQRWISLLRSLFSELHFLKSAEHVLAILDEAVCWEIILQKEVVDELEGLDQIYAS